MAGNDQGNFMVPNYHREGNQNERLSDRHIYYLDGETHTNNGVEYLLVPNTVKRGYLIDGRPRTEDKKNLFGVSPRDYYLYITQGEDELSADQRMRVRKESCQYKKVRSHAEKQAINPTPPEQPQYIPVFDLDGMSILRLPLGRDLDVAQPQTSIIKLYIPTNGGGDLTLTASVSVSEMTLHYIGDADDELALSAVGQGHFAVQKVTSAKALSFTVKPKKFGWYYVRIKHPSAVKLSNQFGCDVIAQDGGADWVPWNFWYYPFNPNTVDPSTGVRVKNAFDPNGPCEHFDTYFRCSSLNWEKGRFLRDNGHMGNVAGSDGHCDDAALASIIFLIPKPQVGFTESDLKFYATEYCRRACETEQLWTLPAGNAIPTMGPDATDAVVGDFHQKVVDQLVVAKEPVLMDLRGDLKHPNDVFNHAVYRAKITYQQFHPVNNERDIQIETVLRANFDNVDDSGTPETGNHRECTLRYRVSFDDQGKSAGSPTDDWQSAVDGSGKPQYPPRYIHRFKGFLGAPRTGKDPMQLEAGGNPEMTLSRLTTLVIKLRARCGKPRFD